ncbi:hypothetical protein [Streptomyces albidoflavus]|uniref:hypothetical protein n=1 Tax=Streptomyces albidoflavus TaxID=1886 RepID=UPI0033AEDE45
MTGANNGTGREAAERLAGTGARVVLAVRTPAKGEQAREEILVAHPGARTELRRLSLADLHSACNYSPTRTRRPLRPPLGPGRPDQDHRPAAGAQDKTVAVRLWAEAERLTSVSAPVR